MYNLVFIDTETTGLTSNPESRLCQVAYKVKDTVMNELFKPPVAIDLKAMAVHKITEEMVSQKPMFKDSEHFDVIQKMFADPMNIFIAHNSEFDLEMFNREGIVVKTQIDTKTISQRLLKKSESGIANHKLQTLREYFDIQLDDARAHDALGDILVLEQVFIKLFEVARAKVDEVATATNTEKWTDDMIIEYMIKLSNNPLNEYSTMPFGKYSGMTLKDMLAKDKRYCEWLVSQKNDPSDKLFVTLKYLLENS